MSTKEKTLTNSASIIEELSDEALTACVGGTGTLWANQPAYWDPNTRTYYMVNNNVRQYLSEWESKNNVYSDPSGSKYYSSDRNIKENFQPVDVKEILSGVAKLPISTWNYKQQNMEIRHIGPMAQDFAAIFGVGDSDQHIHAVDANGVALAAIQALYKMLLEKDATIGSLRADLDYLKQQVITSKAMTSVAMPAVAPSRN